ncbi:MAG: hypothetical protein H6747_03095 [Deltaproteobacteria bacterium]|nr:hypothetical protein [Deltaproteobacteria bacterium]
MLDVFQRLKVVSLDDVYVHEGVVERWVERIADFVRHDGMMKNPIVVAEAEVDGAARYVVLDGMHRVQSMRALGSPDILIYVSDYWSEEVRLESWDAVLLDPLEVRGALTAAGADAELVTVGSEAEARARVYGRDLAMAISTHDGAVLGLRAEPRTGEPALESIIRALRAVEDGMDAAGVRAVYTPSSRSLEDFHAQPSEALFLRPRFSKQEVLERTLAGKLFPRKSTRFLVPERPLRVDFQLTVLKAALDLPTKNQLLQDHLTWCWENNRVRYYPEPVYVFGD